MTDRQEFRRSGGLFFKTETNSWSQPQPDSQQPLHASRLKASLEAVPILFSALTLESTLPENCTNTESFCQALSSALPRIQR